jgi:hypothetical protein
LFIKNNTQGQKLVDPEKVLMSGRLNGPIAILSTNLSTAIVEKEKTLSSLPKSQGQDTLRL